MINLEDLRQHWDELEVTAKQKLQEALMTATSNNTMSEGNPLLALGQQKYYVGEVAKPASVPDKFQYGETTHVSGIARLTHDKPSGQSDSRSW